MTPRFKSSLRDSVNAIHQWHAKHALILLTWISTISAVVACVAAIVSVTVANKSLDFETRLRELDDRRAAEESRLTMRDALFRAKLQSYADYANGSMRTLRKLTPEILARVDPPSVLRDKDVYALFKSYIYDAALGTEVGEFCVDHMFRPTHEDLTTASKLKTDYFHLEAYELTLLEAVGIHGLAIADSASVDASRVYELKGPYMTISPLPSTDLAMPIVEALKRIPRRPAGTMLQASGAQLATGDRFQFAYADDGEEARLDSLGIAGKEFIGRVRIGVGMAARVYDLYFQPKKKQ